MATDDGGPAFPGKKTLNRELMEELRYSEGINRARELSTFSSPGMSLRDYFAGQALAGLLAAQVHGYNEFPGVFPGLAYDAADAMLATEGGTDDGEAQGPIRFGPWASKLAAMRAVAREEIERAAHETPEVSDKPRSGAQVSAGVRVRVTEEAVEAVMPEIGTSYDSERYDVASRAVHAAAPHMEVTISEHDLWLALSVTLSESIPHEDVVEFARDLGLTLTDGGSDA